LSLETPSFSAPVDHRDSHSSPTRRSSDLGYKHIPQLAATATLPKQQPTPNADIMKKLLVPILAAFCAGLTEESNDAQFIAAIEADRKSTRLNSSHVKISYAVFCLKKKNTT